MERSARVPNNALFIYPKKKRRRRAHKMKIQFRQAMDGGRAGGSIKAADFSTRHRIQIEICSRRKIAMGLFPFVQNSSQEGRVLWRLFLFLIQCKINKIVGFHSSFSGEIPIIFYKLQKKI
jgi:hypothetical protein